MVFMYPHGLVSRWLAFGRSGWMDGVREDDGNG